MKKIICCLLFLCAQPLWAEPSLTIYSGRSEKLVGPILKKFESKTGITLRVRFAKTGALGATLLEEGERSPADIFLAQEVGVLGVLSNKNLLSPLSQGILEKIAAEYVSKQGDWLGVSGRIRTVDYNVGLVNEGELPPSIWGFTSSRWGKGKIGWAPTNASFQSFVTAFILLEGEERARQWLRGIKANQPQVYPKNTPIIAALGRGEIEVGFVNNYYLHRFQKEEPQFPVAHHYTKGDAGCLLNISGVAVLKSSKKKALAERFVAFLLSEQAQTYFAQRTFEYPLKNDVPLSGHQKDLRDLNVPSVDLTALDNIERTLVVLKEEGLI